MAVLLQVSVLLRLHGALNVANLVAVYEDADCVHLVMELCRGGELLARARKAHYSERTVRFVMRTNTETCGFFLQRNKLPAPRYIDCHGCMLLACLHGTCRRGTETCGP